MPSIDKTANCPKRPRRRQKPSLATSTVDHRTVLACRLDMLAGCELQHGHHLAAEHLARRAQALREARL
jgi:hypothetical protein